MSRGGEARDFNLIQDNSSYVQTWSIAQIVVVILCTVIQVRKNVENLNLIILLYVWFEFIFLI